MKLAVLNLTGGGFSQGYKKYLKNILPRLAAHKYVESLLCVSPEGGNDVSAWFEKPLAINYCSCSRFAVTRLGQILDRRMIKSINKFSPDIIFLPVDRYIKFNNVPVVNMVRNMEPFLPSLTGDSFQEMFKKLIKRRNTCNSVKMADHTIAVSGFVKDYLTSKLDIAQDKVSLVYHGLDHSSRKNYIRPISIPSGWDDNFLFTCGSIRPARGLEDLIEALVDLKSRNIDMKLVIAGQTTLSMKRYQDSLKRLLVTKGLSNNVCWTGNLSDEQMNWCYDKCRLFIMTSRIEACPNIAIEALSGGAILIAADNPPLPEFFADCALYYQAGNGCLLAGAIINRMGLSLEERKAISTQAQKRSEIFSWDLTAEKTIAVIRQVLDQSRLG